MIFASNVFTAHPGHADEFTGLMGNMLVTILEHDVKAAIKVTVSGTNTTEVFINSVFNDMQDFSAATANMRRSSKWVEAYMALGNSMAVNPVDSFIAEVLPGFDEIPSLSEGVIMANMWKPLSGRLADLKAGMSIAKDMHISHGASSVRAYQVYGGRYTGCFGYNVTFPDMHAMGSWWDAGAEDNAKFFDEAGKNPSADLHAQIIMDNPAVIGK